MHWFRQILVTVFAIEFIGASILSMMVLPPEMLEGRIAMFIWVMLIITGAVALYIKSNKGVENRNG